MTSSNETLRRVEVRCNGKDRFVKCFCNKLVQKSIVPHMKKDHPEVWKEWCLDFVRLWNEGKSCKQIMKTYSTSNGRLLFSWTVIEREIRKAVEQNEAELKVSRKNSVKGWEPSDFKIEATTVWNFRRRGEWAVHKGDYRGNWSPQVPRNLILKYTQPNDWVFDPFVGGGTTLIEAWITNRKSIGIDISPLAYKFSEERLIELEEIDKRKLSPQLNETSKPILILGDARYSIKLLSAHGIKDGEIDLICAHPPYLNSLRYTETVERDLSRIGDVASFCEEIGEIARQLYTLLKDDGYCAILIGDVRKQNRMIPLGFEVMNVFRQKGFRVKDIIVKLQNQDQSTEFYYGKSSLDYLIAHEYLFIFSK